MDTVYPNETQRHSDKDVQASDIFTPQEFVLTPRLTISHSPSVGLIMTGTIAGLADWYEADKLGEHTPAHPGDRVKCDLMELIYLFLTRVYDAPRTDENLQRFFDVVFNDDLEPVINFEIEKVAVVLSFGQCQAVLSALGADMQNYDSVLAAHPVFPPI